MTLVGDALQSGRPGDGTSSDRGTVGTALLRQTATFDFEDTGSFDSGIQLPANAQITDILVDVLTAWDSATSDALEIGTEADPDAYGDIADLQAAGRAVVDFDATQGAAIADIGNADVPVFLTINSAGGSLTQGSARITVVYAPADPQP